jgi:transcriptional regulator
MYIPAQFEQRDVAAMHAIISTHPLATWVVRDADELIVNHVPFVLDANVGDFGMLRGHVARANPVWQRCESFESKVIFHGPQAYISPSWYPAKQETGKVVPTWNYIVVHASGTARTSDDRSVLLKHVAALTAVQEPKVGRTWQVSDAPTDYIDGMLRNIVAIEIPIRTLTGKWKISQHRPREESARVVDALHEQSDTSSHAVADAMAALLKRAHSGS